MRTLALRALAVGATMLLAYPLALKRRVMIDVITLAVLYTTRIVAGGAAIGVQLTF